jgi:hypothetical protein
MKTTKLKNYSQKKHEILAVMAMAAMASATAAHAQVIASDNFSEGTVGSDILAAGAAGNGWAYEWADKNALDVVQSGPLGYTDGLGNVLTTSGNSLQSYGAANPGTSSAEPEPDTVWMSYLWQGNNTSASGSLFRQASILFMKGASGSSTSPGGTEYADIGMPNISSATVGTVNPNVSLWFNSGNVGSSIPSTAPLQSTWAANTAQTYLILVEFTGSATAWSASGNSETMNVWVDPNLTGNTPTEPADLSYTGQDLSGINAIRISGAGWNAAGTYGALPGEETVSDITFGDTPLDVEPVPEPTTLALAALGGLGLLAFRRKS